MLLPAKEKRRLLRERSYKLQLLVPLPVVARNFTHAFPVDVTQRNWQLGSTICSKLSGGWMLACLIYALMIRRYKKLRNILPWRRVAASPRRMFVCETYTCSYTFATWRCINIHAFVFIHIRSVYFLQLCYQCLQWIFQQMVMEEKKRKPFSCSNIYIVIYWVSF